YVVDATDISLGRLSTVVASILRGKNKQTYTPHVDTGDNVIVVNAEKIKLTGKKATDKLYERHSGYPGGLTQVSAGDMNRDKPKCFIENSIIRKYDKNSLGCKKGKKVY